ncbi:Hsp70 family protein [Subdoligranulum variabile]|uniref:Chaperone protein DnaK n=1 Tax=Subdoligranulum variabile DSM 15176 TaxID=411471 RepID=D1PS34_9FIRM|nr:Hsp70 family protein [Subdoligranulum variabile]EFB74562.1 DnaK family protein [Subdoligranulum variabile DSM 15176]UWP69533.1 Hsp70 family protein [Subdoligranulum variabile]
MGRAIGIDLGTTYSAVAVLQPDGKPAILPNSEGQNITPSVVLFPDVGNGGDEPLVGDMAKHSAATSPLDVVQFVKRQMGDPGWRFESTSGNVYTAEEISAIILKKLKNDAELALGEEVTDAVITVPAYFDDTRRVATRQAGRIAGLNVLRVLNEPTAAAISYGLNYESNGTVLVYDLGGGTFDVTIMEIRDGTFDVLATDGNRNLGGFDFDNRIANYVMEELEKQGAGSDLSLDDALVAEIREKSELAKKSLSTIQQANIILSVRGKQYRVRITREQFEELTRDLLRTTQELVEDVMEAAGKLWADIDHLLLIGGSTRMPMVRNMVRQISGKQPELNVNPDEAVALGAAIQAYVCEQEKAEDGPAQGSGDLVPAPAGDMVLTISDVTSQALGVILLNDNDQEENFVVIPKNAKIPTKGERHAMTVQDNQSSIFVRVTQGEDSDVRYAVVIGSKDIPIPAYPKGAPFTVFYAYDIDQTVYVELFDDTARRTVGTFEIDRALNMDEETVENAIRRMDSMPIG